jgi:hydrogenase/urease accessory protein HupE
LDTYPTVASRRVAVVAVTLAAVLLGAQQPAFAHGIAGAPESIYDFSWSGFTHMIAGWDHLLFVAGVLLLSGTIRRAAKMISLFALGHSTTLIIATMLAWRISATAVDIVIALSLVFIGAAGLFWKNINFRWFGAAVLGFGLIHGLGLSTRLQDLDLHQTGWSLLGRVIAFNVGVEVGQLFAIALIFMAGDLARRAITWSRTTEVVHAGFIAAGLIAAVTLGLLAVLRDDSPVPVAAGNCEILERTETFKGNSGHPRKDFYEPTEEADESGFGHVIGDAYIIVQYQPTLPTDQVDQLRAFVTGPEGNRVVAGASAALPVPLRAVHVDNTLSCGVFDLEALRQFKADWTANPRSKPVE